MYSRKPGPFTLPFSDENTLMNGQCQTIRAVGRLMAWKESLMAPVTGTPSVVSVRQPSTSILGTSPSGQPLMKLISSAMRGMASSQAASSVCTSRL